MDQRPHQSLAIHVSQRIRDVLRARGESREWLAANAGIAPSTLARRLHDTAPAGLTVNELNAIALALDVHPAEFLRD